MVAVLALNQAGLLLARGLAGADNAFRVFAPAHLDAYGAEAFDNLGELVERLFAKVDGFVFIMAAGIAVRVLSPLLKDKKSEPGAVVVDEAGDFAVSLVGGHEGGANALSYFVAGIIGAEPVVTTGSETAKDVVVGVGCRKKAGAEAIVAAITDTLKEAGIDRASVKHLATIEDKRGDADLAAAARELGLPIRFIDRDTLRSAGGRAPASEAAQRAFGVDGVCEQAALSGGRALELIVGKKKFPGVTVAVARRIVGPADTQPADDQTNRSDSGDLTVIGIGQGGDRLTIEAQKALARSTDIVGYRTYIRSISDRIGDRVIHESGMGDELERVRLAVDLALSGKRTALVSSGDAGVYGMAGPVFEYLEGNKIALEVEVVPGVTAASAAAATVGAPLMNDYAVISLSDIMTPWPVIVGRLEAVAAADLVVALYNPKSSKRKTQIVEATEILLRYRGADTPVAVVRNAGKRPETVITDLGALGEAKIDMRSTVIIGNTYTGVLNGRLVTRRGYKV